LTHPLARGSRKVMKRKGSVISEEGEGLLVAARTQPWASFALTKRLSETLDSAASMESRLCTSGGIHTLN